MMIDPEPAADVKRTTVFRLGVLAELAQAPSLIESSTNWESALPTHALLDQITFSHTEKQP